MPWMQCTCMCFFLCLARARSLFLCILVCVHSKRIFPSFFLSFFLSHTHSHLFLSMHLHMCVYIGCVTSWIHRFPFQADGEGRGRSEGQGDKSLKIYFYIFPSGTTATRYCGFFGLFCAGYTLRQEMSEGNSAVGCGDVSTADTHGSGTRNRFSSSPLYGTRVEFSATDGGASPTIKPPLEATNTSGGGSMTTTTGVDESTGFAHDVEEGERPAQIPARASSIAASPQPLCADDENGSDRNAAAMEESSFRRSAAMSMVQSGTVNALMQSEGSLLGQTVMLGQSTKGRTNIMSPSVVVSRSFPPLAGNTNCNDSGAQEICEDCADGPSITVSLANSTNESVGPWKRVQLVPVSASGIAGASPMLTIPVESASDAESPKKHRTNPPRHRSMNDPAASIGMQNSQKTAASSISFSDRTPQREGSPSRPPSSACSTMDMSRQLNISGMSGSMSFRPPVGGVSLADLPKGSPLVFDSSTKVVTPTCGTPVLSKTMQQPKSRPVNRPTSAAVSQFFTTFCGRSSGLATGNGLPLSRGVMGGSGGNPLASSAMGHVFTDPHDMPAAPKSQKPPTTPTSDSDVFRPWLPLGLEQEVAAAEVTGWTPLGNGPELPEQSCHGPILAGKIVNDRDKDGDDNDGYGKKSMSPARPEAIGTGFSVNEDGGNPFSGVNSTTLMEATLLEMNLHDGSMSVSVRPPPNNQAAEGAEDDWQGKDLQEARENGVVEPTKCKDTTGQLTRGRHQPSLRNQSESQMNKETHGVVKPDAAAASSTPGVLSKEEPTPTRHE
ncbi:hypothetical protein MOQ_007733 [Trypanosoma cruzi marinkellei]|uniref:Uncharacterized protein n=1 Tax=Trypanosoma cruzi marinkellei TaxID=85056 RepID=K2NHY1_TRYCR|nr:hypothetical protein MOQ_007733 [Trypanosoma cruzi marinkellei]